MTTALRYLDDPELYESTARIVHVSPQPDGGIVVILDETIFYPQGGGQPTDRGRITTPGGEFELTKASFVDGDVLHTGRVSTGDIAADTVAHLYVDAPTRQLHARLHTGGHLVMTGIDRLLHLPAVKGYHFPDGPYVQFEGTVPVEARETLLGELQDVLDDLVAEDSAVTWRFESVEALRAAGVHIPAEIPAGKPTRVVVTAGYHSPCGGTHVRRLGALKGLKARSVKTKSGTTRVSYGFD